MFCQLNYFLPKNFMQKYILEIKNRVLLILISYFSTISISYYYKDILLFFLLKQRNISIFTDNTNTNGLFYFIFTDVTEIFYVYLKLIIIISFQIIIIKLFYHFFLFFSPALYKNEFNYFKLLIKSISFVGFISLVISNYLIIPLSWYFFLSFKDELINNSFNIHFEAKLVEYFNFYISLYYICGLYFQFFLLLFFVLSYVNKNYKKIKNFRKIFYFFISIFSAILCPDFFSQILISFLFILFYEIFLFIYVFTVFYEKYN